MQRREQHDPRSKEASSWPDHDEVAAVRDRDTPWLDHFPDGQALYVVAPPGGCVERQVIGMPSCRSSTELPKPTAACPDATTLSLDGKNCTNGRCGFEAKKGQTYRLSAKTSITSLDELCIVVARP
jgi:hypothetical protein